MYRINSRSSLRDLLLLILLCVAMPRALHATSVLAVDMQQLVNEAAVIFEGEVIASEARWNPQQNSISTHITFRVLDLVKGSLPADTITLTFAGGTVGDTTLRIDSMVYPAPGEQGIYFLENPARQQVNPLLGWSQGHFRVKQDDNGEDRVLTADNAPVLGVEEGDSAQSRELVVSTSIDAPLSRGAARGLRLGQSPGDAESGLDKAAFKRALRELLGGGSSGGAQSGAQGSRP